MKDFTEDIKKSIELILRQEIEYNSIREVFIDNEIDYEIVEDLFIFLPIVFCRVMLPQVNFPDSFIEKTQTKEVRKKYDSIPIYNQIKKVSIEYFTILNGNEILKIAGLSAEFKVINELLLKEGGENETLIEKVKLTEVIINR